MRLDPKLVLGSAALVVLFSGCWWDKDPGDTSLDTAGVEVDTDTDADADTDTDTDADTDVVVGAHGTINGTVTVTLFEYDDDGNITYIAWEDTCFGDVFPYGDIFVTAFHTDDETGAESYYGDDLIGDPSVDGSLNTFSLSVDTDEVNEVNVYAVLDKWFNRVIEPTDPIGLYAEAIVLQDDETVNDVNIEILTQYWCGWGTGSGSGSSGSCPDCPPGWGSGSCYSWDGSGWVYDSDHCGGGGCADGTVTVGGDLTLDIPYNGDGADVGTFLIYPGTNSVWWVTPDIAVTGDSSGAAGQWGYSYCKNGGTYEARGVWDDNHNGLYDPSDTWGQPVDSAGEPLNSITFGTTDEDVTMLIPVGGSDFSLVPFVRLSGTLTPIGTTFEEIFADQPGDSLYIVLGKYRPNGDFSVSALESTYDYEAFTAEELAGQDSVDFAFIAPADTTVFLWASTDRDSDGTINDPDEAWACMNEEPCALATGDTHMSDLGLFLSASTGTTE